MKSCDLNVATCSGDPFAFCGTDGGRTFLSVYQKGKYKYYWKLRQQPLMIIILCKTELA